MKTKIYLFRIVAGVLAFLFSLGIFTVWQSFQITAAPTPPSAVSEYDSVNLRETYPMMSFETVDEPPMPKTLKDEAETKFDAEGYYYISGDVPKGFEDFENFNVTNKNYKSEDEAEYGKLIAPEGYVQTKKEFKFRKISIGNGQIQFETERIKGISYTFSGQFTETRNFIYLESEAVEKVLEGNLIKKRSGKKIAETQAAFGWFIELSCGC